MKVTTAALSSEVDRTMKVSTAAVMYFNSLEQHVFWGINDRAWYRENGVGGWLVQRLKVCAERLRVLNVCVAKILPFREPR